MLLALLVVAGVVRWHGIAAYSLNPDEGISYRVAQAGPLREAIQVILRNAHPPLFYTILRLLALLGDGLIWMRLPAFAFGCLSVVGMYLLGRRIAGPAPGFLFALVMALSPAAVVLSQVVRPYTMQMAFTVFALYFTIAWLQEPRRAHLVGCAVMLILAVLTHYASIILAGAVASALVCRAFAERPRRVLLRQVVMALLPVALVLLLLFVFHLRPHVIGATVQIAVRDRWFRPLFITSPIEAWRSLLGVACYLGGERYGLTMVVFLAAGLLAALVSRARLIAAMTVLALALAMGFSAAGQLPFGGSRHSFFLMPFLLMPAACLFGSRQAPSPRRSGLATAALGLTLSLSGPVNSLLNAGQATILRQPEQLIKIGDYARMCARMRQVTASGGLLLGDSQSFYALAAEFKAWEPLRRASPKASTSSVFIRGKRTLVVRRGWSVRADNGPVNKRGLANMLTQIDSAHPDLNLMTRDNVWLVQCGWEVRELPEALERMNGQASPETKFLLEHHCAPSFHLLKLAAANYLRALSAAVPMTDARPSQR